MSNKKPKYKLTLIFLVSVAFSLLNLYCYDLIVGHITHQNMISGSIASKRESDGAPNLIVMDGNSGFVGTSSVRLKYHSNGYVSIKGKNDTEQFQWKKISEFEIKPGKYTLTGLSVKEKTIDLRLIAEKDSRDPMCYYQHNEDVTFEILEPCIVRLHFRVYPGVEINTIARPAIYEEKSGV